MQKDVCVEETLSAGWRLHEGVWSKGGVWSAKGAKGCEKHETKPRKAKVKTRNEDAKGESGDAKRRRETKTRKARSKGEDAKEKTRRRRRERCEVVGSR
jgi:hypothetical protein